MPDEKIYLKQQDLEALQRAQRLASPEEISERIGDTLRRLAASREAEKDNMEEIELKIGIFPGTLARDRVSSSNIKTVKFYGRKLGEFTRKNSMSESSEEGIDYTLYQTRKGKFLLHVWDWSRWQNKNSNSRYQVYERLDEIEEAPDPLIEDAKKQLGEDPAIYLDL